ncbi:MAG: transpeptidase family protein [bacterium]|nr:transpeptidase family protein [bacterium]
MNRSRLRLKIMAIIFTIAFVGIAGRAVYLASSGSGTNRAGKPVNILRGAIQDRRGLNLAVTEEASTITVAADELVDADFTAELLSEHLNMPLSDVLERFYINKNRRYFIIKRQVDNLVADQLVDLKIPGVYREREYRRVYPGDTIASNLLGFVGRDQRRALAGVERDFNDTLTRPAPRSPREGPTLRLTIDAFIQHRLEREMGAAFEASGSKRAAGIIIDVQSGEILAMVSLPNFDPNRYYNSTPYQRGNWNIRLNYEPGSTVKVFMAAILLAEKAVSPGERFFCDGEIKFHNSTVRCRVNGRVHKHGNLNLSKIIARSCNVGIIKAMQRVRRDRFYDYMQRLGFGQKTEVLPPGSGETFGYFPDLERWVPSTSYYMPIGQGFSVTPIQLLRAGASLANGGRLVRPYIARQILDREGAILHTAEPASLENPFSQAVNREVMRMMQGVVEGGTGAGARVPGLTVAGKTGTGEKSSARGYLDRYVASFMGFFPVENPRYGGLILFDEPRGASGGSIAAPVFGRTVEAILPLLEDQNVAVETQRLAPLPVHPPRVDPEKLYDFRGLAARDALSIVSDYYHVPVELKGSGYVYGQAPEPGTNMERVRKVILYLEDLR